MLPEQELVEALARIDELEALVQSFDAVDKARQAELAFMTSERDYLLGSVDPKLTALREAGQDVVANRGTNIPLEASIDALAAALEGMD